MDVCIGPLICYEVAGPWGDIIVRRLAECEKCGEILVIADELDPRHMNAAIVTDRRRV